jgi:hypothetical protein
MIVDSHRDNSTTYRHWKYWDESSLGRTLEVNEPLPMGEKIRMCQRKFIRVLQTLGRSSGFLEFFHSQKFIGNWKSMKNGMFSYIVLCVPITTTVTSPISLVSGFSPTLSTTTCRRSPFCAICYPSTFYSFLILFQVR